MSSDIFTLAGEVLKRFGYLFYILNPSSHNYENLSDVKDYYYEVTPIFYVAVLIEQIILYRQNKPLWRYNSTISSSCQGILMEISKIPCRGAEVLVYVSIYKNYRLIELPWDSSWTWILCWFAHDFFYYWMHRISHQVNIFWAIHETHHAPEVMMLPSALQSHVFNTNPLVNLPSHGTSHTADNILCPFSNQHYLSILATLGIHKLPAFVEFIFITPSHHRAHHGRNRRYIDKNFGGFLVIWDRLFGTFEAENAEDKPLYGVTQQMKSFNPLLIQTRQFRTIWKNFQEYKTIDHKLSALFKGPGWSPGKPWVGRLEDIPDPVPKFEKFNPKLTRWCIRYAQLHFAIFLSNYILFSLGLWMLSKTSVFAAGSYFTFNAIAFGFTLDKSPYTALFELMRCVLYFIVEEVMYQDIQHCGSLLVFFCIYINRMVYISSSALWIIILLSDQPRKLCRALSGTFEDDIVLQPNLPT